MKKFFSFFLIISLFISILSADAFPFPKFRIGVANTDLSIIDNSGSSLKASKNSGNTNEKWKLSFISSGVFKIISVSSGNIFTLSDSNKISLSKDSNLETQQFKIDGIQKDYDGYFLYYKIVPASSPSLALTYNSDSSSFSLSTFDSSSSQKFKINLDGLEGFAANAKCNEGEKAGTIGGLFGKVITVSTDTDLIKYLDDSSPLIVVVSGSIDMKSHGKTRIRDNKHLIGAYSGGKLVDCELRTNNEYGKDEPSDNIVIQNIDFLAKNIEDRILLQIWSSRQIWIDHCSFISELNRNVDEVGKFIWLNTPYEDYLDKKDRLRSIDYITISYCLLRNRFWTVAYGTQNTEITRDRTTVMYNWWDQDVRRCPQIGNGNMHVICNYYTGNDNGNDQSTDQIIGGDGSNIVSENCRFQSITPGHEITVGGNDPYRDSGSYKAEKSNSTPVALNYKPKVTSSWYPNKSNYGYSLIEAYNTKGTDTKDFCTKYAGRVSSESNFKFITDSDMKSFIKTTYSSPFINGASINGGGESGPGGGSFTGKYMFKNKNSGMYMEVADGKAESGANVQQWGANGAASHNSWEVADAGDGYSFFISQLGDKKTYYLDVAKGDKGDGTNIDIWGNDGNDAKKFKIVDNGDGTVLIKTKSSGNKSCIGVESDSKGSGANVIQWTCNGQDSQKWIPEKV